MGGCSTQLLQYFVDYAKHFDLQRHIHLRTKVVSVDRLSDGRWQVVVEPYEGWDKDADAVALQEIANGSATGGAGAGAGAGSSAATTATSSDAGALFAEATSAKTYGRPKVRGTFVFDAVMVASGHHWNPRMPKFKGEEVFKGTVMHSHSYKDSTGFEGKNAMVVGIGNSGGK